MPDMDGISTFVRIKDEIDDYPPIIMVTGHGTVHLAVEFMKNGGKDFVPKPIDFDVLMLKIERVLDSVLKDNYIKELQREKTEMAILLNAAGALNHEINNPLNVIFQSIEHLQGKACDTHNIQRIKEAMVTIKEVVKNFNEIKQVKKKPYVAGIDILDIKKSAQ
jgi:FixJ family two-component response regulator